MPPPSTTKASKALTQVEYWTITLVAVLLALGFVPALIGAWVFELTPDGLRRESEVDRSSSITRDTGRKLNIATIAMVLIGIALLAVDRYLPEKSGPSPDPGSVTDAVPVIAVLPFQATGSDDGGFLATGLHDDLLTMLHKIGAYRVLSRTSVMEYADRTKNMREIGAELGASHILEGGVQARGNRVRINAQLIDAAADELPNPYEQTLVTRVSGEELQRTTIDLMIFRIEKLIE